MNIPREVLLDLASKYGSVKIWADELQHELFSREPKREHLARLLRRLDERYESAHRGLLAILEDL